VLGAGVLDSIGVAGVAAGVIGVAGAVPLSLAAGSLDFESLGVVLLGVVAPGAVVPGVVAPGVVPVVGAPGVNGALAGGAFPNVWRGPLSLPISLIANMQKKIQTNAVMIVTRVNTSPAFVPKALCPPMPPKAPAKPPPLPCWIKTKAIKNSDERTSNVAIKN